MNATNKLQMEMLNVIERHLKKVRNDARANEPDAFEYQTLLYNVKYDIEKALHFF